MIRLKALTDRKDILSAYHSLAKTLRRDGRKVVQTIGYPSGNEPDAEICWHGNPGIWFHFILARRSSRHVIFVGTREPGSPSHLPIDFELNFPVKGKNLRVAGAFGSDSWGNLYITHSGKIGGGTKGIGKSAFLDYRGARGLAELVWPDESRSETLVLARITSPDIVHVIHSFATDVAEFKIRVKSGTHTRRAKSTSKVAYSKEFWGKRSYTPKEEVEANVQHGRVVHALRDELQSLGFDSANDGNRDLYISNKRGRMTHLFEVKTKADFPSLTKAVGQLSVYPILFAAEPNRVIVLPQKVPVRLQRILKQLDIRLLEYSLTKSKVSFKDLEQTLK